MQHHQKLLRLAVLSGALCVVVDGQAAPILDINMAVPTTGSLSYAGGGSALIGTNISLDTITATDTAAHNLVDSICVGCVVNFNSGALVSYTAATKTWLFSGGGSIVVTGGVDFADSADIAAGTALLTGTFTEAEVIQLGAGSFKFKVAVGAFTDTKDPILLAYYGLPTDVGYEGGFNLSFTGNTGLGNSFTSSALLSGDIFNSPVDSPVPAPAALWLLGSGLVALGSSLRRKKSV